MSEAWIKALTRAALPGAVQVRFERRVLYEDGTPTTRYRLESLNAAGATIGDDRDYDLLKAVMMPLEALSEAGDHTDLTLVLNLETVVITSDPALS